MPEIISEELGQEIRDMEAEIKRLEADLREVDCFVAVHQNSLDPSPRFTWPKGSVLEKAIARHEARIADYVREKEAHSR